MNVRTIFSRTGIITLLLSLCLCARGEFNCHISAGDLRAADGSLMPASSLVLLVADIDGNGFGGPTAGSFVSGDDAVLIHSTLDGAGIVSRIFTILNVAAGIPVQLYWFPTIAATAYNNPSLPLNGTQYGSYRDPVANGGSGTGRDGSDPWFTIGSLGQAELGFVTESEGGSNHDTEGVARWVVGQPITLGIALGTNGTPILQLTAAPGHNYLVQSSTNLTDWTDTALLVNTNGTMFFTDAGVTNSSQRFYRAVIR